MKRIIVIVQTGTYILAMFITKFQEERLFGETQIYVDRLPAKCLTNYKLTTRKNKRETVDDYSF